MFFILLLLLWSSDLMFPWIKKCFVTWHASTMLWSVVSTWPSFSWIFFHNFHGFFHKCLCGWHT